MTAAPRVTAADFEALEQVAQDAKASQERLRAARSGLALGQTGETTMTEQKCGCCLKVKDKDRGQWWFFVDYDTGTRLINGSYCPHCADRVYLEKRRNKRKAKKTKRSS